MIEINNRSHLHLIPSAGNLPPHNTNVQIDTAVVKKSRFRTETT